ncbi:MAG: DUF1634 domain-containing protein, partial [Isosphaeraceae bacterium]
ALPLKVRNSNLPEGLSDGAIGGVSDARACGPPQPAGGVMISGLLIAGGLVLALVFNHPRPEGTAPSLSLSLQHASRGHGIALMNLGLLALMVTPVLRVAVLAIGWGMNRDRRFLAVALGVLVLLTISPVLGVG